MEEDVLSDTILHTVGHCRTPGCKRPRTRVIPPRYQQHLAHYCSKECYEKFVEETRKSAKARVEAFMKKNGLPNNDGDFSGS